MHDDTLVCTACDEVIRTTLGYDGYIARCSCSHFALQAGSGEKPRLWERLEDLLNPSDFTVENDWSNSSGDIEHINCNVCGTHEATTVDVEKPALAPLELKATFTCSNAHYQSDNELTETVYYRNYEADKLREYCTDGPDDPLDDS